MTTHMVVSHRRYTKADKQAYRARGKKRRGLRRVWINGRQVWVSRIELQHGTFNFADLGGQA